MDAENENIIFVYITLFNNWQSQLLSFSTLGSDESFGDASWIKIFNCTKIFKSNNFICDICLFVCLSDSDCKTDCTNALQNCTKI